MAACIKHATQKRQLASSDRSKGEYYKIQSLQTEGAEVLLTSPGRVKRIRLEHKMLINIYFGLHGHQQRCECAPLVFPAAENQLYSGLANNNRVLI